MSPTAQALNVSLDSRHHKLTLCRRIFIEYLNKEMNLSAEEIAHRLNLDFAVISDEIKSNIHPTTGVYSARLGELRARGYLSRSS
eukprot:CAMPEP_0201531838 /NCGR_PEP_ID=MMETSP0161_2-20130828/48767_1 /ASSEMBLY_ACC=CAM_ASM_000251 /TAXON_ID=180227 /ORGANISM="Neoparamoeba aestuarina, Strain SoJaBio B1-5/56/2" /LENGTH=84 /DNA_ID=CAMNT_0047934947 /DNA_START=73 /DNA_END=324 /DNA_ORIENTATION=-